MESEDVQSLSSAPGAVKERTPDERKKILAQTLHLSIASVVAQVTRFAKNVLLAGMLGPASFGLWNGLQVFITYAMNSHLGVLQAMARDIPMSRGAGSMEDIPRLATAAFSASLLFSVVGGIVTSLLALWMVSGETDTIVPALLLVPVVVVQMVFLYGQFFLRAMDEFVPLSRAFLISAPLELVITVAFTYALGLNGVLIGLALSQAIGAVIALRTRRSFPLRFQIDRVAVSRLIRTGFPIVLTVLGYFVLTTIDRLIVISFSGSEALGYYSLGSLAITALGYIPIAVNQVMFPKFASRFGETGDAATLSGYLRIPALLTAHTMGFVLSASVLCLPLVTIVLPTFAPGIPAAAILLAGFYFVALTGAPANLMLTINRQGQYLMFLAGAIVLAIVLDIAALTSGRGIEGVAAVTALTNFLYLFTFTTFCVRRHLPPGAKPFGRFQEKLLVPWLLGVLSVWAASLVSVEGTVITTVIRLLLLLALYVPVSLLMTRREKLW
jgi:O-antigen/teichoic acid export membrane protein